MVTNWVDRRPSILQPAQPASGSFGPEGAQWNLSIGVTDVGFCTIAASEKRDHWTAVLSLSWPSRGSLCHPIDLPGYANGFQKFHRRITFGYRRQLSICRICRLIPVARRRTLAYLFLTRSQRCVLINSPRRKFFPLYSWNALTASARNDGICL